MEKGVYKASLTRQGLKRLWLMGTLCRLASLKFLSSCPYSLNANSNDLYMALKPRKLFSSDEDIVNSLRDLVGGDGCMKGASESELNALGNMVLSYADCPVEMTRIYLRDNEKNLF